MSQLDIIIPVKNEAENISELVQRIDRVMRASKINYGMIFVDDHSTDATVEEIENASSKYPITLHLKEGKGGKAYSILEGAKLSKAKYLAMIDGDLQYPPEVLSQMFELVKEHGVVVANRKKHNTSFFRRVISKASFLFGRLILGFNCDVQSGLKMFKREVIDQIRESEVRPWTIDMNLLRTAIELGYSISHVEIDFVPRKNGQSKIRFLRDSWEIGSSAIGLKFRKRKIYKIKPPANESVIGTGVVYRKRRFVTHTHLPHPQSALQTFQTWQKLALSSIAGITIAGLVIDAKTTAIIIVAILSLIYFLDFIFSLYVLLKSLHSPPEIKASPTELGELKDKELPIYSVLCPLYKEAKILPHFLEAIDEIDWPKDKLDVLLLLEEDDKQTQEAAARLGFPSYVRKIIIPQSQPKTKPKACNYGLAKAKGEYVVIYDAEDKPDPRQLKKAYLAFNKLGREVFCLQSKLNYYNTDHNLLTRLFTAEYSLWFDLILPGLQSIETIIPLGGTSNHFRTQDLKTLHAWDPFNVTEDCDLGARLFKAGYKTAMIDSTTYEEANSNLKGWLRQRSRWIKGYLQTYLVHMREPVSFFKSHGIQALIFQLVIGMRMVFILINPILWLATISYFAAYSLVGPKIETLYPTPIFYMAVTSLVLGNFIHWYNYMIGCAKREHWGVIKFVFLVPFYWAMTSMAATIAFYQLFSKPYYWEKTHHGLHLQKEERLRTTRIVRTQAAAALRERVKRLRNFAGSGIAAGGILVAASVFANFLNFLYNIYLGRKISFEEFGLVSLIGSFLYLIQIPLGALDGTVTHQSAYLLGKHKTPVKAFWSYIRKNTINASLFAALLWVLAIPMMAKFFRADSILPFILFTPIWFVGTIMAVDMGYLSGNLKFSVIAGIVVVEALAKLLLTVVFVETGKIQWIYAVIPLSMTLAFLAAGWAAKKLKTKKLPESKLNLLRFPKRFFATSILLGVASVAFLSFDVMLAKHYLTPQAAGEYALLSLVGKMVFFVGSLFTQFINPLVSRHEGASKNTNEVFYKLLLATALASMAGFVAVGLFGRFSAPILLGSRVNSIVNLLPFYTLAMGAFVIGKSIVTYHQVKKQYFFALVSFFVALAQVFAITVYHHSVQTIAEITAITGIAYLAIMTILHLAYYPLVVVGKNMVDFLGAFARIQPPKAAEGRLRVLVLNWRDTKHLWAGGAEVYIHELAKRWVAEGHRVTVFCGNDGKNPRNEVTNGVQIVRRGGFYMVYFWAFLYYILKFRNNFDIIIDSENGIPFFTPLYARQPVIGLVHHVHREIILKELKLRKWLLPVAFIAKQLESKLMPLVYKHSQMVTVSRSSKNDMEKIGFGKNIPIEIVNPGVDLSLLKPTKKTEHPTVLYLGRLKAYKSIGTLIKAIAKLLPAIPSLELKIAGFGDDRKNLEQLTKKLKIEKKVKFLGRVSEKDKVKLLGSSWVFAYPSTMEGWGISALEANACGTPVVASDVPGLRDSVHNPKSGILVEKGNVQAYQKMIGLLLTNKNLRRQFEKNSLVWASKFSWHASANSFLNVIKNELERK